MLPTTRARHRQRALLGGCLGWTIRKVTLASILAVPALLVLQVAGWVSGYGGGPVTLTAVGRFADLAWRVPAPWGAVPLLVPVISVPLTLHLLAWLVRAQR